MKKNFSLNSNIEDNISNEKELTTSDGESTFSQKDCDLTHQINFTRENQPISSDRDCQQKDKINYENETTALQEDSTILHINSITTDKIHSTQEKHLISYEGTKMLQINYKPLDEVKCIDENQPTTSSEDLITSHINSTPTEQNKGNVEDHKPASCGDIAILHIDIPQTCHTNCSREDEASYLHEECTNLQTECEMSSALSKASSKVNSSMEEDVSVVIGAKTVKFQTQISIGSLRAINSNIYEGMRIIVSSQDHIIDREEPEQEKLKERCSQFFNSQTVLVLGYGLLVCTVSTVIVTLFMFIQKVEARIKAHHHHD